MDGWRSLADHVFDPDTPAMLPHEGVVWCKTDYLRQCFEFMARRDGPFTLITGQSDKPINECRYAWKPPTVIKWYGVNMTVHAPDTQGIPVGLAEAHYPHGDHTAFVRARGAKRDKGMFACFAVDTNPQSRWDYARLAERNKATMAVYETHGDPPLSYDEYVRALHEHRLVLSPPGNGYDCHRHWESLYAGAVPVIERSAAMRWFEDSALPILWTGGGESDRIHRGQTPVHEPGYWRSMILGEHGDA